MGNLDAAIWWIARGAAVLPVQPGSKYLVKGFGPNLDRITKPDDAAEWFTPGNRFNLAILPPPGLLALDFDNPSLYVQWAEQAPVELVTTYTETSPRGWHVFAWCKLPAHAQLVPGVEVKRVIVCAPSVIGAFRYTPLDRTARIVTWDDIAGGFGSLLLSPSPTPPGANSKRDDACRRSFEGSQAGNLVERTKASHDLVKQVSTLTFIKPRNGDNRWWEGVCPWHDDHRPSLWVDAERRTWGCFACGAHGDLINWYAMQHKIPLRQAIRELGTEVTA